MADVCKRLRLPFLAAMLLGAMVGLQACGSHIILTAKGHRPPIKFGIGGKRLVDPRFSDHQVGTLMGVLDDAHSNYFMTVKQQRPVQAFTITTVYELEDVLLHLIPFYASRTVHFKGEFK